MENANFGFFSQIFHVFRVSIRALSAVMPNVRSACAEIVVPKEDGQKVEAEEKDCGEEGKENFK